MIHLMKLFALSFTLLIAGCSLVLEDPRPYPEARRLDAAMMPVDMAPPPVDMAPPPRRDLSVRRPMELLCSLPHRVLDSPNRSRRSSSASWRLY